MPDLGALQWKLVATPKPGERTLQVEFYGAKCDGKPATDAVKVAILDMKPDGVRLAIGTSGKTDGAGCGKPGYVTMTIDLPEPIGDRPVFDVAEYPEAKQP
jgi:hypothetical protein